MSNSSNDRVTVQQSGIGFSGLLTIVFIVLKLTSVINWGWVWVLSPLWIPLLLALVTVAIILIIAFVRDLDKGNKEDKS